MYEIRKYHGDKVMSLTYEGDKESFSVGILAPGEYGFGSIKEEIFTVTSGMISVNVEGTDGWQEYKTGETFAVPAHRNFSLKVDEVSSYICYYR